MKRKSGYNKVKKILQSILIILIILLIVYIATFFVTNREEDLVTRVITFFKVFTVGIDTKIQNEDNTILDEIKQVEIEQSTGEVEVQASSKQPILQAEKKEVEDYAAPTSTSANSLYYNQLDEYGKIIYTKLKNESGYFLNGEHVFDFEYGFNDLLNTEGGDAKLKNSFQYAVNALFFDYPELFFVDIEKLTLVISRTEYNNNTAINKVKVTNVTGDHFYIKGLNTKTEVNARRKAVYDEREKVLNAIKNMKLNDKIKYIQNYIIDKTEYDVKLTNDNIYNITGPIIENSAVCEGYAKAFKFLMDGANIPTILVVGKAYDNGAVERHAWNYVNINNKWYLMDVTWNDPIIEGGSKLTDEYRYRYFLVGRNKTRKTHVEDGNIVDDANFKYPVLSANDYIR